MTKLIENPLGRKDRSSSTDGHTDAQTQAQMEAMEKLGRAYLGLSETATEAEIEAAFNNSLPEFIKK